MFLSLALGLYLPPSEPVGYRDLRSLSAPQLQTTLDRLPKSEGQVLLISAFGSWQTWTQTATRQAAITHLSPVITLAHQKGYVVVTEWNCLYWPQAKDDPAWRSRLEDRAGSTYRKTGEYDYVSPFDPRVRRTLLDTAADLAGLASNPPDAFIVTYQLPRSPLLLCGQASRQSYLQKTGLDPVDMLDSPTLYLGDQPNRDFFEYLSWRTTESNRTVQSILAAVRKALPSTMLEVRADPLWTARTDAERGSKLNDWPQWLSDDPKLFLLADSLPQVDPLAAMAQVAATPTPVGRSLVVWFMVDGTPESVAQVNATLSTSLAGGRLFTKIEDRS